MESVQIKQNNKKLSDDELNLLSTKELINKIRSLEAHNNQLRNIIAKNLDKQEEGKSNSRPYDFSKCHFRHVLLKFFYLGWDYQGYATQEDTLSTIEHHLFKALRRTCLIQDRNSSNYHRCGRTDKGVSSYGQVVSIDLRSKLSQNDQSNLEKEIDYCDVINRCLPDNIQCVAWCPVEEGFSARFDCKSRTYKYFFPKGDLNIENMSKAAQLLLGTHDFRNLCKMDVGNGVVEFYRNVLYVNIEMVDADEKCDYYSTFCITIKGKAFLWHQIRCIMAILFLIGQNKEEPELISHLLNVDENPRKPEYQMASEIPLNLFYCEYDDVEWVYNKDTLKSTVQKLRNIWSTTSIKSSMIKYMLTNLEQQFDTAPDRNFSLTDSLLQGVRPRKYIPIMKRQRCESLEDKIKHYVKRNRIEIVPHKTTDSNN